MSSEAIPFQQPDQAGNFHINPVAAEILRGIKTKIVVVAVAGPYRTGKSYLLNRLISPKHGGFTVGNTVNACTKGIWLWGQPLFDKSNNTTYIYLDTEGLNSTGEEVTFDTQIFSLSVLISSAFILNTQGSITESALEQLELVAECSKSISFKPASAEQEEFAEQLALARQNGEYLDITDETVDTELALHFPAFTWVLRDFNQQLQDKQGNPLTSNEYLELQLKDLPETKRGAAEKNRIRRCIKSCFLKRKCVPLVRPAVDEDMLQRLFELPVSAIRPEFEAGLKSLKESVHNSAPKQIKETYLTGETLMGLTEQYVEAINTGKMPSIQSAWQSVQHVKISMESQQCIEQQNQYLRTLSKQIMEESTLLGHIEEYMNTFEKNLQTVFLNDTEAIHKVITMVKKNAEPLVEAVINTNNAKSLEHCKQAFYTKIWKNMKSAYNEQAFLTNCMNNDVKEVESFFYNVQEEYLLYAVGPQKMLVLQDILETQYKAAVGTFTKRVSSILDELEELEEKNEICTAERDSLKQDLQMIQEKLKHMREASDSLQQSKHELQRELELLKMRNDHITSEVSYLKSEQEEKKQELVEQKREAKQYNEKVKNQEQEQHKMSKQFGSLESEVDMKTNKQNACLQDLDSQKHKYSLLEKELQHTENSMKNQSHQSKVYEGRISELEVQLRQNKVDMETNMSSKTQDVYKMKELQTSEQSKNEKLENKLKRAQEELSSKNVEVNNKQQEVNTKQQEQLSKNQELLSKQHDISRLEGAVKGLESLPRSHEQALQSIRDERDNYKVKLHHVENEVILLQKQILLLSQENHLKRRRSSLESYIDTVQHTEEQGTYNDDSFVDMEEREETPQKVRKLSTGWDDQKTGMGNYSPQRVPDQQKILERRRAQGSNVFNNIEHKTSNTGSKRSMHERVVDPAFTAAAKASLRDDSNLPELKDPGKCTIPELKSWLTDLNVDLNPNDKPKKSDLVNMVKTHDPRF